MSFGTGAQQWIKDQMGSMITNNVTIMPKWWYTQWTDDDVHWYVKAITLTTDLVEEIETYFPELTGRVTYGSYSLWMIKNEDDILLSLDDKFLKGCRKGSRWFKLKKTKKFSKMLIKASKQSAKSDINSTSSPWAFQPELPKNAVELKKK